MPELRKDPIVNRWVIIATERAKRPTDFKVPENGQDSPKGCPFCPGNESKTPPEIDAVRPNSGSRRDGEGWVVRVVPNKFPALRIEGEMEKFGVGIYDRMNGIGAHEVIIETTDHFEKIEMQSVESLFRVFSMYKARLEDLKKDERFRYILLFKNEGITAGASLSHPHSQLIATPVTPKRIREELVGAQAYYEYKDRCIFCDIIREELRQKDRIVYENNGFIAFCPFAARFPFEIWALPKKHHPDYDSMGNDEIFAFADAMKVTLGKLVKALNGPHYNYMLHTGPVRWRRRGYWATIEYDFHWHVEIIPRLVNTAGFEWGTGFYINPTIPEEAARFLQEIQV
jgi:UDPglucose--hexose-1-phosphate uridylyltransferase